MGHKRSLVRQTDWKPLGLAFFSNVLGTRLPLPAENEANDAFVLEPLRIEREGYFNPAIRRPVDVEHEPRGGKLDRVEPEVPRIAADSRRRKGRPDTELILRETFNVWMDPI
jgi:hypothetical protein